MKCPRCGDPDTKRSHRRFGERLLSWLGLFPFRCGACGARFRAFSLSELRDR